MGTESAFIDVSTRNPGVYFFESIIANALE